MGSSSQWIATIGASLICFVAGFYYAQATSSRKTRWNTEIRPDAAKVSDTLSIQDAVNSGRMSPEGYVSICRCWKSANWPYCDG
ncbi:MAG: hypothetical protein KVP17_000598 [Porospora cf. gigantea B]|uniref:uncharacterized protein n=1 Tax=Porospora cf. gigantea B TaxID=2853592 RepID=UPI003571C9FF|nr:MAG: hypothetical protein KVP17_000598 [Porospora cf. gigantea B]